MNLQFQDDRIPGTRLKQADVGGVTGLAFLRKVFFISNGVMLTQIREISGIDSSTLQNWTKRGWVANSRSKKYNIDQVAHILIINMLRSCMQLDRIAYLIQYINGDLEDSSDDIISDSVLYDYICRIVEYMMQSETCVLTSFHEIVEEFTVLGDNLYRVDATAELDKMFEFLNMEEIESESTTVSGWVVSALEKIPEVGDTFEADHLAVKVTETDSRRVLAIEVSVLEDEDEDEDEDDD